MDVVLLSVSQLKCDCRPLRRLEGKLLSVFTTEDTGVSQGPQEKVGWQDLELDALLRRIAEGVEQEARTTIRGGLPWP